MITDGHSRPSRRKARGSGVAIDATGLTAMPAAQLRRVLHTRGAGGGVNGDARWRAIPGARDTVP